jgi:NADPH:quinone reductase-like Zn-dependent oxidoreductase
MKALLSVRPGGPETLELRDIPDPAPAAGELLVRVSTCGVNFPDALIIDDRYQARFARPFSPGGEVSGVVEAVGAGVSGHAPGDQVVAFVMLGGMAERLCVPAQAATRIAAGEDGAVMAQLVTTYATSWHALVDRGHLAAGETVLVLGAAGGVGIAAVDIAAAMGARVVAGVSSPEKAAAARAAGAYDAFIYPGRLATAADRRALAGHIKEAVGPHGADIVYDPVGGALTEAAFRALAWGGRHLVVGFPAGIPSIAANLALLKGGALIGVFMGAFAARAPAAARRNIDTLLELCRSGRIRPTVSARYPLERAAEAIAAVAARRAIGKTVVDIDSA